jgi:hypothetical protein
MWSEPFIRTTKASGGEKLAVLLMDTQGMFDNETTMTLTAQIFGLSTLVSSFQVRLEWIQCVWFCCLLLLDWACVAFDDSTVKHAVNQWVPQLVRMY